MTCRKVNPELVDCAGLAGQHAQDGGQGGQGGTRGGQAPNTLHLEMDPILFLALYIVFVLLIR